MRAGAAASPWAILRADFRTKAPGPGYAELAPIEGIRLFAEKRLLAILREAAPSLQLAGPSFARHLAVALDQPESWIGFLEQPGVLAVAFVTAAVSAVVDPSLVVLGGGVGANASLLEPVRRHVAQMLPDPPRIVTSALGDRASLFGAIAVALEALRTRLLREGRRLVPDGTLGNMHRIADEASRRRALVGR